jgi:hypothetical protein
VSANARRPEGPRQTLGAKTEEARPRTAHAMNPLAAAMGRALSITGGIEFYLNRFL